MGKIRCKCSKCECKEEFEVIAHEHLLNAIQHGRLNPKQIEFAKKRIGDMVCAQCFAGKHGHLPGFEEKEGVSKVS